MKEISWPRPIKPPFRTPRPPKTTPQGATALRHPEENARPANPGSGNTIPGMNFTMLAHRTARPAASLLLLCFVLVSAAGCGSAEKEDKDFFTSGNREADQRADQRMAKAEQLQGDEADKDKGKTEEVRKPGPNNDVRERKDLTLYERLGGDQGITAIIDDFTTRALADPRVNWERKGVKRGGFSLKRNESVEWQASAENVATLKKHMAQFLALATGGPAKYEGKDMAQAHADMRITNAEFDATVGDLKATLDKLGIPNQEQKELLAIVESTRPQVVVER